MLFQDFNHVILVQLTSSQELMNKITQKSKKVFEVKKKVQAHQLSLKGLTNE